MREREEAPLSVGAELRGHLWVLGQVWVDAQARPAGRVL